MSMLAFNLLHEAWLPVLRRRSGPLTIRLAEITSDFEADPVIAIAWPRPDFRIAALEFLIGLLSTAMPPVDKAAWKAGWYKPPRPESLEAAFAPFAGAFDLDGDGPRFLQDLEEFSGEPSPPASLLIDAPGENALKNNTDLLVKRGGAPVLSRAAAAMALFTLQDWAPSGGAGHRTGFRGGGPLTVLPWPEAPNGGLATLWHLIWASVEPGAPPAEADLPKVFPWLAPTRTSGKGEHPPLGRTEQNRLQCYWAMPRRIRLDFAANTAGLACGITGVVDPVVMTGWRSRPYGAQYDLSGWTHPLSPHYRQKLTDPWLPMHAQPGGIGYRHWTALVLGDETGLRAPAEAVRRARRERAGDLTGGAPWRLRLLAAGYDMDNAKARGFVESEMPLPTLADADARERLDETARRMVEAATLVADLLRGTLRTALFGPNGKPDLGSTVLQAARDAFWAATEEPFYGLLHRATEQLAADPEAELGAILGAWRDALRRAALAEFDAAAPLDPDAYRVRAGETAGEVRNAHSLVSARRLLGVSLAGYGKAAVPIYAALNLPLPEAATARGKARPKGNGPARSKAKGKAA